jgi:ABC-2 type transport system ATP-binding protein
VAGIDVARSPEQVKQRISLTGQSAAVDDVLTGAENLVMLARLSGLSKRAARVRAAELLERFALTEAGAKRVGTYSGGMRRRLDLALSFVVTPEVLFLDEPTTGLDTRSRRELWDVIRSLAEAGTTVFLTTQYLEEADQLADRIVVVDHGTVIAEGTSDELKDRVGGERLEVTLGEGADVGRAQAALGALGESDADGGVVSVRVRQRAGAIAESVRRLDAAGIEVADVNLRRPTLDDVFLTLTGHAAEAAEEEEAAA